LTNKLVDFYGPSPQNLTKLLLEEKKLQENSNTGSTPLNEQTDNTNSEITIDNGGVASSDSQSVVNDAHEQKQVDQASTEQSAELFTADMVPNLTTVAQDDHSNSDSGQTNQPSENSTMQNTSDLISNINNAK